MPIGRLEIVCGPMFAGKSTELLARARSARAEGRSVEILKASFDVRYGSDRVVTHEMSSVQAKRLRQGGDLPTHGSLVLIDEIQFLAQPWFDGDPIAGIEDLMRIGVDVVGFGLDFDSNRNPFPAMEIFLSHADLVTRLRATCTLCGAQAAWTAKKKSDGPVWELGGADLYEARCDDHWHA